MYSQGRWLSSTAVLQFRCGRLQGCDCLGHALDTHRSTPSGWARHIPTTSTQPRQLQATLTLQRPHVALCGSPSHAPITTDLTPFNFSSDIKHYLNSTAHRTRQPLLPPRHSPPCPAPPASYPSNRAVGGHAHRQPVRRDVHHQSSPDWSGPLSVYRGGRCTSQDRARSGG